MKISVAFEVNENFNLTGTIKNIDMKVSDVKTNFYSDVDADTVNAGLGALQDPLKSTFNSKLRKGVTIPIPESLQANIN